MNDVSQGICLPLSEERAVCAIAKLVFASCKGIPEHKTWDKLLGESSKSAFEADLPFVPVRVHASAEGDASVDGVSSAVIRKTAFGHCFSSASVVKTSAVEEMITAAPKPSDIIRERHICLSPPSVSWKFETEDWYGVPRQQLLSLTANHHSIADADLSVMQIASGAHDPNCAVVVAFHRGSEKSKIRGEDSNLNAV
uniref:Protein-serine/threonine phosphatase n=1 Tax=Steinernema glaseri TaxID=37863 RepID=A0A1I7ZBW9_9BILA